MAGLTDIGAAGNDDEPCGPESKTTSQTESESYHIKEVRNRRRRYRDISKYPSSDGQNFAVNSIGRASDGSGEKVLRKIMYLNLLDHLPTFLFCFTLQMSRKSVSSREHKSGSPAPLHLILAVSSEHPKHLIHVYKSPISDIYSITIRSSNHRFFCQGPTCCEQKSSRLKLSGRLILGTVII
jgi:hypothetical protein